jgi:hypothetical protein
MSLYSHFLATRAFLDYVFTDTWIGSTVYYFTLRVFVVAVYPVFLAYLNSWSFAGLGGWGGIQPEEICSILVGHRSSAEFYRTHAEECNRLIWNDFSSKFIAVLLSLAYLCAIWKAFWFVLGTVLNVRSAVHAKASRPDVGEVHHAGGTKITIRTPSPAKIGRARDSNVITIE